jgi:amino acid adenylation domain-containing protein
MLFDWFREGAARHPEATAIEVTGEAVRYRELLDLAERLASRLVEAAGGRVPGVVGVLATRSLAAHAGYLAGLRLAATVVPLRPDAPVGRNAGMCRSSGVDTIVADAAGARQLGELAAQTGAAAVELGSRGGQPWYWSLASRPWSQPMLERPEGVAYIIFTSGSTGEPKGVPIRHRHLADFLPYLQDRYRPGPGDRFAQPYELTFDGSVLASFTAWRAGATVVVPGPEELLDPTRLIATRRLSHWFSVPSVISIARRHGTLPPASMPELRLSSFGGEQLTLDLARAWAAAAPHSVIENLYGPTELTVICTDYQLPSDQTQWPVTSNGTVPIGPIHPHLEAVVLTGDGTVGAEGELCVRGPQRFDGYLDPAHNQGSFVHFDGERARPVDGHAVPADAFYRTGDRVGINPDGVMVHLGRLDDQVKVRGYRVELGEIEAAVRAHPKVQEAVVLAVPPTPTLHAVYTGEPVDDAELAATVAERLPPYMRPVHYRWLVALPVNPHGKVDRRRIAAEL